EKQILTAGLILAALLAGLVGYWYFMIAAPSMKTNLDKQTKLRADIKKSQDRMKTIEAVLADETKYTQMVEEMEIAKRRLPSDPEALEFLQILTDCLNKTAVDVSTVRPSKKVRR